MEITPRKLRQAPRGFRRPAAARDMLKGDRRPRARAYVSAACSTTRDTRRATGPGQRDVPAHVRAGLLRHRDDVDRRAPRGHRALRLRGLPRLPAPGRPAHPLGRVSIKMAPIVRRIYDQMLEPKWAIAMGAARAPWASSTTTPLVPADKFMPWTSTCRAARRGRSPSCTGSSSCARRSSSTRASAGGRATAAGNTVESSGRG
jgi:NADH-quinone oxidoreductase subunit B